MRIYATLSPLRKVPVAAANSPYNEGVQLAMRRAIQLERVRSADGAIVHATTGHTQ
jgi:hypothetical protein